jgi:hypothetical protein
VEAGESAAETTSFQRVLGGHLARRNLLEEQAVVRFARNEDLAALASGEG